MAGRKAKASNSDGSKPVDVVPKECAQVWKAYGREIIHMRSRRGARRLGIVIGAEAGKLYEIVREKGRRTRAGMPDWRELLERISADTRVGARNVRVVDDRISHVASTLRHRFCELRKPKLAQLGFSQAALWTRLSAEWLEIVRDNIYSNENSRSQRRPDVRFPLADNFGSQWSIDHPYLRQFLDTMVNSGLTINLALDSCLEMMLQRYQETEFSRGAQGASERCYDVVLDSALPFGSDRKRRAMVLHPNGYLPHNPLDKASASVVFSEQDFLDPSADFYVGRHTSLQQFMSQYTMLFMGTSIADSTLQRLLRQSARHNPGHCHYWIESLAASDERDASRDATRSAFFDNYNLVTLSLTPEEIAALGWLIACDGKAFATLDSDVPQKYVYYVLGVPGVGKSSILRHMNALDTVDEWIAPPLVQMGRPRRELRGHEEQKIEDFVNLQFAKKNARLLEFVEGVFLVDRAPLDPLTFAERAEWPARTRSMRNALRSLRADGRIQDGVLLLVTGDPQTLGQRFRLGKPKIVRNKRLKGAVDRRIEELREMQQDLQDIYRCGIGFHEVNSSGMGFGELLRAVARTVYLDDYAPAKLSGLFDRRTKRPRNGTA